MKKFFPFPVILSFFILDRITKLTVINHLKESQSVPVWPGVFHLTRVNNTGAAFGMLKGNAGLLALVAVACVIGISAVLIKDLFIKSPAEDSRATLIGGLRNCALALVAAGAAGNLYDRIHYGYVIDFLDFRIWPVFNIADSGICAGIFLIVLSLTQKGKNA